MVMKVLGPDSQLDESNKIERIVDMTIAYPEGKPLDIQSIVTGWRKPCNTHVHYRSWDVKVTHICNLTSMVLCSYQIFQELPKTSGELFNWMVNLYQQKEQMLDEYYKTGNIKQQQRDTDYNIS